jgi:inner membrane protein
MPTILSHAVAGVAIAQTIAPCSRRAEISLFAAGCAMLPDIDVIGFRFGVHYGDLLGHRGLTHSLLFALLVAATVTLLLRHRDLEGDLRVFACLFVATASHGFLDAFTNGGLGVAFFSPFHPARYFFPFRPILVSPLDPGAFLGRRGIQVLLSETEWVWMPALALFIAARLFRCREEPEIGYNASNPSRRR